MNWTGGRLSRHSRGGATAALNQRQKSHFAKVQNDLRNGTEKQSPIKWSIFGKFHVQQPEREQQRSLEPRAFSRDASLPVPHGTPGPVQQERVREDDLYTATPQPLQKRKREETVPESGFYKVDDINFMSKKRKKLLEKRDWVGISYQRPLQMTFASLQRVDNVGRRRKITDGHQVRYANRQSILISPFINRAPFSSPQIFEARGKTDVRIHIGNRVVPPGISSSTALSRRSRAHSMHEQKRERSLVASSDVMLLDNEDILAIASSRLVNETPFEDQQADTLGSNVYYESQQSPSRHAQDRRNHELGADEQVDGGTVGGRFGDDSAQYYHNLSSPEVDAESGVYVSQHSISPILGIPFSPTLIKHPVPQSSRVSSILHSSSSAIPNSTVAQVGKVNPVVPSSQVLDNEIWETWMAPLYNEEPTRSQHEHECESIKQERTISPGISTAPARRFSRPASKRHQNSNTEVGDVDKASRMMNPSIRGSSANEDYLESWVRPRKPLRQEPEGRSRFERAHKPTGATQSLKKRSPETSNIVASVEPGAKGRMSNIAFPFATLRPENHLISHAKLTAKLQKEDNPDDLWRKFVFGSDETNESQHLSQPKAALGFVRHDGIVSSVMANPSAGLSANSPIYTHRQSQNTPSYPNFGPQFHTPSTVSKADTSSTDIPWDQPKGAKIVANTISLSAIDDFTSLQSFKMSLHPFHGDLALVSDDSASSSSSRRAAASMAAIASFEPETSKSSDTPPSSKPLKVLFTKSKRYEGTRAALKPSQVEREPLHIGRGLMRDEHRCAKTKKERDIYSLVDSDENLHD